MTLATHAVVGAAAASLIPSHPLLGFAAGFASHFVVDAIPHWDYPIYSSSIDPRVGTPLRLNPALVRDMRNIGGDMALGIALSLLFFAPHVGVLVALCGAFGGILPDPLQFVYSRFKHEPLISLQRFHMAIHSKRRLREEGLHAMGLLSQGVLVGGLIAGSFWFLS